MTDLRPTILVNGQAGAPEPRARVEQLHHLVEILGHQADIIITNSEAEMNAHLHRLVQAGAPRVAVACLHRYGLFHPAAGNLQQLRRGT